MDTAPIETALKTGHKLAEKIKSAKTVQELKSLNPELEQYCDFLNKNFGEIDEFDANDEKYCQLSFYIFMAVESKISHLSYGNDDNSGVDDFLTYLNSKEWAKNSAD